jgi:hypothetical protein
VREREKYKKPKQNKVEEEEDRSNIDSKEL